MGWKIGVMARLAAAEGTVRPPPRPAAPPSAPSHGGSVERPYRPTAFGGRPASMETQRWQCVDGLRVDSRSHVEPDRRDGPRTPLRQRPPVRPRQGGLPGPVRVARRRLFMPPSASACRVTYVSCHPDAPLRVKDPPRPPEIGPPSGPSAPPSYLRSSPSLQTDCLFPVFSALFYVYA